MIFDLSESANKLEDFKNLVYELRNKFGGMIIAMIIPRSLTHLMYNVEIVAEDSKDEFFQYGYWNKFGNAIFIDKTLTDQVYLICNTNSIKLKVINGQ